MITKVEEFEGWVKGDLVKITEEDGIFRFHALASNSKNEQWVDVYGPLVSSKDKNTGREFWDAAPSGAAWRSFNLDRIVDIKVKTSSRTDSGTIKERGEKKMAEPQACLCGCEAMTKGGKFIPGHDARMKGAFIREYREATTEAAKAKIVKAVGKVNPLWTKYLTEAKPRPVAKAAKAAKAAKTKGAKGAKGGATARKTTKKATEKVA